MLRRARPLALAFTLALAATACSRNDVLVDPEPVAGIPGDVARQRQVWNGQGLDDYRFAYARTCFCLNRGTVQITVRDGRVVDVLRIDGGDPVPPESWAEYPTVDALFDRIAQARAAGEFTEVTFHPTLGYPVEATIGTLANDAGTRHTLSGLEPL